MTTHNADLFAPSNGAGRPYVCLANRAGKRWVIDAADLRLGLMIYEPGSLLGRLVKRFLPLAPLRRRRLEIDPSLHERLGTIIGRPDLRYAVFFGTPGAGQKTTIQIMSAGQIVAYAKLSPCPKMQATFAREAQLLERLAPLAEAVPRSLFCQADLFVQTTTKGRKATALHRWTTLHAEFVQRLETLTAQRLPYEQTDLAKDLVYLASKISILSPLVKHMLDRVEAYLRGRLLTTTVFHADLTPWNTYLDERGQLCVFDWEYARAAYLPGLDECHFRVQTAIFERHMQPAQIVSEALKSVDPQRLTTYLLCVMSIYLQREDSQPSGPTQRLLGLWEAMLNELI